MENSSAKALKLTIGIVAITGALAAAYLFFQSTITPPTISYIDRKLAREQETYQKLQFDLVDPNQAPESIRALAREGYLIMIDTRVHKIKATGRL